MVSLGEPQLLLQAAVVEKLITTVTEN